MSKFQMSREQMVEMFANPYMVWLCQATHTFLKIKGEYDYDNDRFLEAAAELDRMVKNAPTTEEQGKYEK